MCAAKPQTKPQALPPTAGEPNYDLLNDFKCSAGKRYNLPDKWHYHDREEVFFNVIEALKNYDEFVKNVQESETGSYSQDAGADVPHEIKQLQRPFGECANPEKRCFKIDRQKYTYVGPHTLNAQGKLPADLKKTFKRMIFTPSKGRSDVGLLHWELPNTLGVVVVPREELDDYSAKWSAKHLIIGCDQDSAGAARHHILKLARHWELKEFWMIDDSCPTSEVSKRTWNAKEEVENKVMTFETVVTAIEAKPENFSNAGLIGLTSNYSIKHLKSDSSRHIINKRTPTACVFVWLPNVPDDLNYDSRLKSKEDVIFAACLILAGKDVIIDRHIQFTDYPFTVGGCTRQRPPAKEDPKVKEVTSDVAKASVSGSD